MPEYGNFIYHDEPIFNEANTRDMLMANALSTLKQVNKPHGEITLELNTPRDGGYQSGWRAMVHGTDSTEAQ